MQSFLGWSLLELHHSNGKKKRGGLISSAWSYRAQVENLFPLHVKALKGVARARGKLDQAWYMMIRSLKILTWIWQCGNNQQQEDQKALLMKWNQEVETLSVLNKCSN